MKLNENKKDDVLNPHITLSKIEKKEIEKSDIYKKISTKKRHIKSEEVKSIDKQIDDSNLTIRQKAFLKKRIRQQCVLNENFFSKNSVQPQRNGGSYRFGLPDTTVESIIRIPETVTPDIAFSNFISKEELIGPSGLPIEYLWNGHKTILYKSGDDRVFKDYHAFAPDITVINVSNESILRGVSQLIATGTSKEEYVACSNSLTRIKKILDATQEFIDIGHMADQVRADAEIFASHAKKMMDSPIIKRVAPFLKQVSGVVTAVTLLQSFASRLANERPEDALIDTLTKDVAPLVGAAAGTAIGAAGGPIGSFFGGLIGGVLVDGLLNMFPSANGYTISENMTDHGLNDFKFQRKENKEVMSRLEVEFSERLLHGISWKVKDALLDTPELWIRPGQSQVEPWQRIDGLGVNIFGGPTSTFSWGNKVRFQDYEGTTKLREQFESQNTNYLKYHTQKPFYSDVLDISDPGRVLKLGNHPVMFSDRSRYFNSALQIDKWEERGWWIFKKWHHVSKFDANPWMRMHEADGANDDPKGWNWNTQFLNAGIPMKANEIGTNTRFSIRFDDGNVIRFNALETLLKDSIDKADEYVSVVKNYGKVPVLSSGADGQVYMPSNSLYKAFDWNKTYIPIYTLKYIKFGDIRFNTYDDSGRDATHVNNLRYENVHVGISCDFYEVNE